MTVKALRELPCCLLFSASSPLPLPLELWSLAQPPGAGGLPANCRVPAPPGDAQGDVTRPLASPCRFLQLSPLLVCGEHTAELLRANDLVILDPPEQASGRQKHFSCSAVSLAAWYPEAQRGDHWPAAGDAPGFCSVCLFELTPAKPARQTGASGSRASSGSS